MKKVAKIIRRICRATPHEWLTRGRQLRFTLCNRWMAVRGRAGLLEDGSGKSLRVPVEQFSTWWQKRAATPWCDPQGIEDARRMSRDGTLDSQTALLLKRADQIVCGKMPLFSFEPIAFVGTDRWHTDFVLKKTTPRQFYGQLAYLDVAQAGDSKFTWEPNRFGWAYALGIAYQVTEDPRYFVAFCRLTEDWFVQNPYPLGINYCSALEIALRNYAWLWALQLFAEPLQQRDDLVRQLLAGIWIGCRHVEENLSTYFSPNTHLTGEAFSLLVVGMTLPEFAESQRWSALGEKILVDESDRQIFKDGTHAELSTGYQIYTTDFYLHAVAIADRTNSPIDTRISHTALRLAIRLSELVCATGHVPALNDCDGGRLTGFATDPMDARPSLSLARKLFPKQLPEDGSKSQADGRWLSCTPVRLVARGAFANVPEKTLGRDQHACFDSGIVVHRNAHRDYLLFSASPFGYLDAPHSHDGPLRCIVHCAGEPLLIDPGTCCYTADRQQRNLFRSALVKNVLTLAERGPSEPGDFFGWHSTTDAELVEATWFADGFRCRGKHTGYSSRELGYASVHREITVLDAGVIVIVDRWDADNPISAQLRMTLAPDVKCDPVEPQKLILPSGREVHWLTASLDDRAGAVLPATCVDIPYSVNYGHVASTKGTRFQLPLSRRGGCVTVISQVGRIAWRGARQDIRFDDLPSLRVDVGHHAILVDRDARHVLPPTESIVSSDKRSVVE